MCHFLIVHPYTPVFASSLILSYLEYSKSGIQKGRLAGDLWKFFKIFLISQQFLIVGEQGLVDFEDIVLFMNDEIFDDQVELLAV